jgi:hypothetical protein
LAPLDDGVDELEGGVVDGGQRLLPQDDRLPLLFLGTMLKFWKQHSRRRNDQNNVFQRESPIFPPTENCSKSPKIIAIAFTPGDEQSHVIDHKFADYNFNCLFTKSRYSESPLQPIRQNFMEKLFQKTINTNLMYISWKLLD